MDKLSKLFHLCAYDIKYEQVGDSVNYAFVEEGNHLYIFFQGSNSITDWVRNFLFPKAPYKDMEEKYYVHRGFLAAWKEVEDIVIKKITELEFTEPLDEEADFNFNAFATNYKWKEITIVGYSHGGSLTFFATEAVWFHRPDLRKRGLKSYAFESPRVLSSFIIPKKLKERWENMTVIRTGSDIVTHCPPKLFCFTHTGNLLKIKGDYTLVKNKAPKCVKYHYPEVVLKALIDYERNNNL